MRKKLVSILIANVLFLSNVGFTSFAVEQNMEAAAIAQSTEEDSEADDNADAKNDDFDKASAEKAEDTSSVAIDDEPDYVKIVGFSALSEEIAYQEIRAGATLDEITFPEILEIAVVPDDNREERISEMLGREREARLLEEAAEAAASASSSSDEEESASEASSEEENIDENDVLFFDSESGEVVDRASAHSESDIEDSAQEQESEKEETSAKAEDVSDNEDSAADTSTARGEQEEKSNLTEKSTQVESQSAAPEAAEKQEEQKTDDSAGQNNEAGGDTADKAPDNASDNTSSGLIGKITSVFKTLVVHAAEAEEKSGDESGSDSDAVGTENVENVENAETAGNGEQEAQPGSSDDASDAQANDQGAVDKEKTGDVAGEEKSADSEDGTPEKHALDPAYYAENPTIYWDTSISEEFPDASIEMVSGIQWVLDRERNEVEEFSSNVIGSEFVFTPILLIPDFYYIEAELPTITVKIVEFKYVFDQEVTVDNVKIRVRAEKGVFPEGATLYASKLLEEDENKVQDAVNTQMEVDDSVLTTYSFDIQVKDKDGKEVEPDTEKGKVIVSFETDEVKNNTLQPEIYHITTDDEGEADEAASDASKEEATEGENVELLYSAGDVLYVEKLDTVVVTNEDVVVLETETDGFSTYVLVFKQGNWEYDTSEAIVNLEEVVAQLIIDTIITPNNQSNQNNQNDQNDDQDPLTIEVDITSATYTPQEGDNYADFFYLERLVKGSDGAPATDDYGLLKKPSGNQTGTPYLVVRRPFSGKSYTIDITYNYSCKDSNDTEQYSGANVPAHLTISNDSKSSASHGNNGYPTGVLMSKDSFLLNMPVVNRTISDDLYQWQSSTDGKTWTDIALANTEYYGKAQVKIDSKVGTWYRCLVNGKESKPIQLITASSDAKNRTWTDTYGATQIYVTNGVMAYTIAEESKTPASKSNLVFDILGEYTIGNTKYMLSTSLGGTGWRIFCHDTSGASSASFTSGSDPDALEYINFSFDEGSNDVIHMLAKPNHSNGYKAFAVGVDCELGDEESNTLLAAVSGTGTSASLKSLALIGAPTLNVVESAINTGVGDALPSLLITPTTSTKLKYYYGEDTDYQPYPTANTTTLGYESILPAIRLGWTGLSNGTVGLDFKLAGAKTNDVLSAVAKTSTSNTYSGGSTLRSIALTDEAAARLTAYAKTLGGVGDKIDVKMTIGSASLSAAKNAISDILPTYQKLTKSSSGTTSTTTKYTPDYFDASIATSKNGGSYEKAENAELGTVLKMAVSYNFDGKEDIIVYRYHNNIPVRFSQNDSGSDESYTLDRNNGKIYINSSKFSTFAVAYQPTQETIYHTVTFDTGSGTSTVKVKNGDKVGKPSEDPTKEGYSFKGWYLSGNTTSTYNFDTAVTKDIKIVAGWTQIKETNTTANSTTNKTSTTDSTNSSRAPKTNDNLPVVWLWVLLLVAGVTTFGCSIKELMDDGKDVTRKDGFFAKLSKALLRLEIVILTTIRFLIKKLQNNRKKVRVAVSGALVLISAIVLATTYFQYQKSEEIYADAEETYIEETPQEIAGVMGVGRPNSQDEESVEYFNWWDYANVNLKALQEDYPDVVGWIYFENEDISYPIVYSGDNTKYLRTTYTGEKAKAGSIFIDGESSPDFSDPHSIVYGHNMHDLSMFGKLRYYKTNPEYYQDHQFFQVFTDEAIYRYQIFACEEVADNNDVFWVYGKEPEGYYKMLKTVEKNSFVDTGITTDASDHVITLATCTSKDDQRLIVSAVRVEEYQYEQ